MNKNIPVIGLIVMFVLMFGVFYASLYAAQVIDKKHDNKLNDLCISEGYEGYMQFSKEDVCINNSEMYIVNMECDFFDNCNFNKIKYVLSFEEANQ